MRTMRRMALVVAALVLAMGLGACGGGSDDADGTADTAGSGSGNGDGDGDNDGASETTAAPGAAGAYPSCPLTVEDVAAVTGEPMEQDPGVCQFHPASGKLNPNVLVVKQSGVLARAEAREETGLVTKVDGIGDEAYASGEEVTGTRVAVRDGQQWFEVEVDILSDPATELDWAKELATFIADNN